MPIQTAGLMLACIFACGNIHEMQRLHIALVPYIVCPVRLSQKSWGVDLDAVPVRILAAAVPGGYRHAVAQSQLQAGARASQGIPHRIEGCLHIAASVAGYSERVCLSASRRRMFLLSLAVSRKGQSILAMLKNKERHCV